MNRSEFANALEKVYGSALGHSLASDLYLPMVRGTAFDALDAGIEPLEVWRALTSETDMAEEAWAHRKPQRREPQKHAGP